MKAQGLNKIKKPTPEEIKEIGRKLMEAGIDKTAITDIFGPVMDIEPSCIDAGPCLYSNPCGSYFRVDSDTLDKLKTVLDSKKIDINKVDPRIRKLFQTENK